jgi:large conductance mechanosensitive channel
MKLIKEFGEFLKEYNVIALAVAFIMGIASTALIRSLVDNIVMPLITPFIPAGGWRTATFSLGPISIGWGAFTAELINFMILAFVVFMIVRYILKNEKAIKK